MATLAAANIQTSDYSGTRYHVHNRISASLPSLPIPSPLGTHTPSFPFFPRKMKFQRLLRAVPLLGVDEENFGFGQEREKKETSTGVGCVCNFLVKIITASAGGRKRKRNRPAGKRERKTK